MSRAVAHEAGWLSPQEACKRLRVHAATLRHWADGGRIRTFRTPGGHRRFSEADVSALAGASPLALGLLLEASIGGARLAATGGRLASESWYARFDEAAKEKQRVLGHDLMRLLVAHAADPEDKQVEAVRHLGRRYADLAHKVGLSLGDAMRAFHLFEGVVHSSAGRLTVNRGEASTDLDYDIGWFLNEVRIAMVVAFGETAE